MKGQRTRGRFGIQTNKTVRRLDQDYKDDWKINRFMIELDKRLIRGEEEYRYNES